ncbi:MAG: [acyl-carrier-protein] S-malonyltransferase [Gemmatimonadetes bacterium]|nr:[acyl-carrier-protein] S-malonyltransferase [Gemmatimonadota bacterium]
MGKDLADRFPGARAVFEAVNEALGVKLSDLMWNGPETDLTLTHNAQPAILAHSLAVSAVARDKVQPVAGAGHSLGEYSAYGVAGALGLADLARLVRLRGQLMHEAGQKRAGTMAAVLGLDSEKVVQVCKEASTAAEIVVAANLNEPNQTVISGDPPAVERAGDLARAAGAKRVVPLKVSGAFHSPLMAPAQLGLHDALAQVAMKDPAFPVVANASATAVTDAGTARTLLDQQLVSPVRWVESMRKLSEIGPGATYIEMGPGNVLSGMARRIVTGATVVSLGTADEVTKFLDG